MNEVNMESIGTYENPLKIKEYSKLFQLPEGSFVKVEGNLEMISKIYPWDDSFQEFQNQAITVRFYEDKMVRTSYKKICGSCENNEEVFKQQIVYGDGTDIFGYFNQKFEDAKNGRR
jgi:hypothetical protein